MVFVTCFALSWVSSVRLEQVAVRGAERADIAEIRRLSGLRNGVRTREISFDQVRERVEGHPWVASVQVSTKGFWRSVVIDIEERIPTALTVEHSEMVYIDEQGKTIASAVMGDYDYPMITIDGPNQNRTGMDVEHARAQAVGLIVNLGDVQQMGHNVLSEVVVTPGGVHVNLLNGSCLLVPQEGQENRISRFSTLIERGAVHFGTRQMIDLTPRDVAVVTPLAASKRGCS